MVKTDFSVSSAIVFRASTKVLCPSFHCQYMHNSKEVATKSRIKAPHYVGPLLSYCQFCVASAYSTQLVQYFTFDDYPVVKDFIFKHKEYLLYHFRIMRLPCIL